jgi:hypothetical protein
VTATRRIQTEQIVHRILLHAKSRSDAKDIVLASLGPVEKITASKYQ